jgi:hypothetical protein
MIERKEKNSLMCGDWSDGIRNNPYMHNQYGKINKKSK